MIENTINQIEAKLSDSESVTPEQRRELLSLLNSLKVEVAKLSQTNRDQADSIAGFAQLSAHEVTRTDPNPELRELSLRGLRSSVDDLEKSHPALTHVVDRIAKMLSDLGI